MVQVVATDREGQEHPLQVPPGTLLMEVLRDAGLGVEAVCGGCCACATCHVYVMEPGLEPQDELELALLSSTDSFVLSQSRLSCQIKIGPHLNNLKIQIAPED